MVSYSHFAVRTLATIFHYMPLAIRALAFYINPAVIFHGIPHTIIAVRADAVRVYALNVVAQVALCYHFYH